MNPNLSVFLKRFFIVTIVIVALAVSGYYIVEVADIDIASIAESAMEIFLGIFVAFMAVLVTGFIVRIFWTGIMNRADSILLCCADHNGTGIHIVARHYHPGGEYTSGYHSYMHYYIDVQSGKAWLSKKVMNDGDDITNSVKHLYTKTKTTHSPDTTTAVKVGSNTNFKEGAAAVSLTLHAGKLILLGYEGLMDYGFKLHFESQGRELWKMRI